MTNIPKWGIVIIEKVLPVDGSPLQRKRSNRNLGKLGGYFFLLVPILASQRDHCNDNHAKSKKAFPCNHTQHPLSISIGGKEVSPPKKKTQGQNRLPFFTGSTIHSIAQNSTNCKEKYYKTGYVAGKCDVPRFYMGVGTDCRRVPFNEARPKSHGFLCAPSPGELGNRCIGTGFAASPERRHCAKSCY